VSKLSVLIVNYNTKALTLECLRSLYFETQSTTFETILVDNASSDGSANAIELAFPQVKLIRSPVNIGFGPANNKASKHAVGKYVLLLNSDTVVLHSAVDNLVAFAEKNPSALIWGGRTKFADGSLNPSSCWRYMSLWSLFCQAVGLSSIFRSSDLLNRESYGSWDRGCEREVEFVSGCFLLITRELWDQLDGFDEQFFMYSEEADVCWRARHLGAHPMVTPEATIIHYGGKSEVDHDDKLVKLLTGKMTFILKHWPPHKARTARQFLLVHCRLRAWAQALMNIFGLSRVPNTPWKTVLARRKNWENGWISSPDL
jgi:N-acetylglucosaminyl-diphospho-decaprenol L-rhamnosyltransferase